MAYGVKVQCKYITESAYSPAAGVLASTPLKLGGDITWKMGSAVPQNIMPVAMVVQITIENHRHLVSRGLAPSPPILLLETG